MSGVAGPSSQFLNGTEEFLELALAKNSLTHRSEPFRSAKAREFGEI